MRFPDEPHVLIRGVLIHVGAVSMLDDLRASGHTVTVDDDELVVEPLDDLNETVKYLALEAFAEDIALLLGMEAPATVH